MAKNIPGMLIILIIYHSATILSTKTGFTSPDVRQRSESCVKSVWLVLHCELPLQWCVRLPYSVYATIPSLPHPSLNPSYRWAHRQGLFQDYRQWHAQWLHASAYLPKSRSDTAHTMAQPYTLQHFLSQTGTFFGRHLSIEQRKLYIVNHIQ